MADHGNDGLIALSLEKWLGMSRDIADSTGCTPLMYIGFASYLDAKQTAGMSALGESLALVDQALEGKAPGQAISQKKTPAAKIEQGHLMTARLLLKAGANVNVPANGEEKKTPLHFAAEFGAKHLAEELLKHGADVTAKTSTGQTPLDIAKAHGQLEMVALLARQKQVAHPSSLKKLARPPVNSAAAKQVWDLSGMPIYGYAVEDFLRRQGAVEFWEWKKATSHIVPFRTMLYRKANLAGTSAVFSTTPGDHLLFNFIFVNNGYGSNEGYATLPYNLRVDMNRREIEQVLGRPDRVDIEINDDKPRGEREVRVKQKNTTLNYAAKGLVVLFVEQKGWLAKDRLKSISLLDTVKPGTPLFNKGVHNFQDAEDLGCKESAVMVTRLKAAMEKAKQLLIAGKYQEAEQVSSQALHDASHYKATCKNLSAKNIFYNRCFFVRGVARLMLGRYEEANEDFRVAIFVHGESADDYYWLGISEILTGRTERAQQRVKDLKAARQEGLADQLQRNITLHKQGKQLQL